MTKNQVKYAFTTAGVAQWQAWLAGASQQTRNAEATLVGQGLYSFLPFRFDLDAEQVAYLDNLDAALCQLWATQLAYAIRQSIPIALVKPAEKGGMQVMNTKFIVSEGNSGNQPDQPTLATTSGSMYFLRFTISY